MKFNLWAKLKDLVWEHEEVIKLRLQFAELDQKTQSYVVFSAMGLGTLALVGFLSFLLFATWSVHGQINELDSSIHYLTRSAEKMDELRQKIRAQSANADDLDLDEKSALSEVSEKVAGKSGIGKDSLELTTGAGPNYEFKLNKISLRQLDRFLFTLENSRAAANVQHILIETRNDPEGYMWASIKLARADNKTETAGKK